MKHMTLFIVALCVLLFFSPAVQARYIVEHQQLHEIIGQYTLTDFTEGEFINKLQVKLPLVDFDEPLPLGGVDRMSITIVGSIGPVTVCGDGVTRPDECYTLHAGVDHNWSVYGTQKSTWIRDPDGVFSDDDPGFEQTWVYDDPGHQPPVYFPPFDVMPLPHLIACDDNGICDYQDPGFDLYSIIFPPPFHPYVDTIQFVVGPLWEELLDIPRLGDPIPCDDFGDECIPRVDLNSAEGLEVVGTVELTITDAYITREWGIIPEPGSAVLVAVGSVLLMGRKKA